MSSNKISILLIILISFMLTLGCKEKNPTPTELQLTFLQNGGLGWVLGSNGVIKDGLDVTSQFTGFKLQINGNKYTTQNGLIPVWQPTGMWEFQSNDPALMLRDDGVLMTVVKNNTTEMTMYFTADGVPTGGRIGSVSGQYEFHLVSE